MQRNRLLTIALAAGLVAGALAGWGVASLQGGAPPGTAAGDRDRGATFFSIAHVHGHARSGLPVLPLNVTDEGRLEGLPRMEHPFPGRPMGTIDVLEWFRYCGMEDALPGLQAGYSGDNVLRYWDVERFEDHPAQWPEMWYADRHREPIGAGEIPEGKHAYATWRSPADADRQEALLVIVAHLNASSPAAQTPFAQDGLVAFSATSTFFCVTVEMQGNHEDKGRDAMARRVPHIDEDVDLVVDWHNNIWNPNWIVKDAHAGVDLVAPNGTELGP